MAVKLAARLATLKTVARLATTAEPTAKATIQMTTRTAEPTVIPTQVKTAERQETMTAAPTDKTETMCFPYSAFTAR